MDRRQLEDAIVSARRRRRPSRSHAGAHVAGLSALTLLPRRGLLWLHSLGREASFSTLVSIVRTPGPLRAVILSAAALAAGVLGLVVAYAVVPQEGAAAEGNRGTMRLVTITGPGGTTTLAVTKTKGGNTKYVPVRLRTVTGPGGVSTLSFVVTGPAVTNTLIRHDSETQTVQSTQTEVVTQPVTVVETDVVTQTETVTIVETTTVTVPPSPGP